MFRASIDEDDTLRRGRFLEASFGPPPLIIAVKVELGWAGFHQLVRTSPDGPPFGEIEVVESLRVLPFPDVFGDDTHSAPDSHREVVIHEGAVGSVQDAMHR